jgi:hypothetical protein
VAYLIFLLADSQSRARSGLPRTQAKEITTRDLFLFCVYDLEISSRRRSKPFGQPVKTPETGARSVLGVF